MAMKNRDNFKCQNLLINIRSWKLDKCTIAQCRKLPDIFYKKIFMWIFLVEMLLLIY